MENNIGLKKKIIDRFYQLVPLENFGLKLLNEKEDLELIFDKKYYVVPNFYGNNCFLCFLRIGNFKHSFILDRSSLPLKWENINYKKVKMERINIDINDESLYKGTIFEGTYGYDRYKNNGYIINDIYYLKGESYYQIEMDKKHYYVEKFLEHNIENGMRKNSFYLEINNLVEMNKIRELEKRIKNEEFNFKVRGLCFYPYKSGTKLVFIDKNNQNKNNQNKNKITNYEKKIIPILKSNINDFKTILNIRKTKFPKVYKSFIPYSKEKREEIDMGIIYLSNEKIEKWVEDVLTRKGGECRMECIYDKEEMKWKPQKKLSSKEQDVYWKDIEDNFQ
jgi:hypothetical protein